MAAVGELLFTGMTDWKNIGRGKTQVRHDHGGDSHPRNLPNSPLLHFKLKSFEIASSPKTHGPDCGRAMIRS
jgi:hypothetical protein